MSKRERRQSENRAKLLAAAFVGTAYHVALASASKLDANPKKPRASARSYSRAA